MRQAKADHDVIGCSGSRQPRNWTKTQIDAGDEETKNAAQERDYVAEQAEAMQGHDSFLLLANSKFDPPGEASINFTDAVDAPDLFITKRQGWSKGKRSGWEAED